MAGITQDVPNAEGQRTGTPAVSVIGPYRIVRLLGRGAFAAVHLAVDDSNGSVVALKTIALDAELRGGALTEACARLLGEAEVAKRLVHPDIVKVHAAGEQHGIAWVAMELLTGCTLHRYTHASRLLPETLVLGIVERLARALAHAHSKGVVHRDIKPGNVMLDLPRAQLKLTDFGIAGIADMSRTRSGVVLGTPFYMAPEQLAGAQADARSDLYSLGVLAFQLLSGRLPHEASSLGDLLRQVACDPAPDLVRFRPTVSLQVAAIVAKVLQKQPSARHADALQLADEFGRAAAETATHGAA